MILLNEIAKKLQDILNGIDSETAEIEPIRPNDFEFVVATNGFHLDYNYDLNSKKNFIPVFVNQIGGTYNPIPDLKQCEKSISVDIYYPVRFKNKLYALNDYLATVLVGRKLTWNQNNDTAISNISDSVYGELVDLDLKQFKEWADNVFKMPIEVAEPYINMRFTLYLTTIGSSYLVGNDVLVSLSFTNENNETVENDNLKVFQPNIQSQSSPDGEQIIGSSQPEIAGIPINTSYSAGFAVYVENTSFFESIIDSWFKGQIQKCSCVLTIKINNLGTDGYTYSKNCYIANANMIATKGQPLTISFSFLKRLGD